MRGLVVRDSRRAVVFSESERQRRWRQNKRPSDTASSHLGPMFRPLVGSGRSDEDESGRRRQLTVALSFCRLLGLGCPKQAFAKIATLRSCDRTVF